MRCYIATERGAVDGLAVGLPDESSGETEGVQSRDVHLLGAEFERRLAACTASMLEGMRQHGAVLAQIARDERRMFAPIGGGNR